MFVELVKLNSPFSKLIKIENSSFTRVLSFTQNLKDIINLQSSFTKEFNLRSYFTNNISVTSKIDLEEI